jgi:murein L,D-transpeptidase YafK
MLRSAWLNVAMATSVLIFIGVLGGCGQFSPPYLKPLSPQTQALLTQKGMTEDSPVLVRIFKAESELEIWKAKDDGRFYLFKTYPICDWSGTLGPKVNQGDRQAPEGFYLVSAAQMNPKSQYHLAFNIGFPNAYDRSNGWTGADIMVHGDCKSAGCYAMTDGVVEEIYILAREALAGGQPAFQVQAYPFRMTAANMAKHKNGQWYGFWRNLKEGYDYFEVTHQPPRIEVCDKRYLVNAAFVDRGARPDPTGACPAYEKLPVEPAPRGPVLQQASAKPGAKQASADADITNSIQTNSIQTASIGKPLGSWFGLTFGPQKPTYQAFTLGPATPANVTPPAAKPATVKRVAAKQVNPRQPVQEAAAKD